MPGARGLLAKFTGGTIGEAAAVAGGRAASRTLDPLLQEVANQTWAQYPHVPPDAYVLAEGVAQGQVSHDAAYTWAKEQGLDRSQMDALVNIANSGPGVSAAYEAWRRGFLTEDEFNVALRRTGLEPR